jgi:hypothetical protein
MRFWHRLAVILVLVGLLLLRPPASPVVRACSCLSPDPPVVARAQASALFSGQVVSIDAPGGLIISSADPVRVTFQVETVWKRPRFGRLVVTTAHGSASCGYPFTQGVRYLVYARGASTDLQVSLCSRTRPLSSAAKDLTALGTGTTVQELTSESSSGVQSSQRPSWLIIFPVGLLILITVSGVALAQAIIVQARRHGE